MTGVGGPRPGAGGRARRAAVAARPRPEAPRPGRRAPPALERVPWPPPHPPRPPPAPALFPRTASGCFHPPHTPAPRCRWRTPLAGTPPPIRLLPPPGEGRAAALGGQRPPRADARGFSGIEIAAGSPRKAAYGQRCGGAAGHTPSSGRTLPGSRVGRRPSVAAKKTAARAPGGQPSLPLDWSGAASGRQAHAQLLPTLPGPGPLCVGFGTAQRQRSRVLPAFQFGSRWGRPRMRGTSRPRLTVLSLSSRGSHRT